MNIILCGFMGSGKSMVGEILAKRLGRFFIDLDQYIEKAAGLSVKAIFAQYGETDFRRREREALQELLEREMAVIAAGGGTLTFSENQRLCKQNGVIVFLDASLPEIIKRLQEDTARPLLQKPDREEVIQKLYIQRHPQYAQCADITVNADESPLRVVEAIAHQLFFRGMQ